MLRTLLSFAAVLVARNLLFRVGLVVWFIFWFWIASVLNIATT